MFVFFLLSFALAQDSPENATVIPLLKHKEGDVCNLQRAPQLTENPAEYLLCLKPEDENWTWNGIGVWVKKVCQKGKVFSPVTRSCKKANAVRRQYINNCGQFGGCNQQYQPVDSCGLAGCGSQGAWTAQQPSQYVPPQVPTLCQGSNCGQQQPFSDSIQIQPIAVQPLIQTQSFGQSQGCGSSGCGQPPCSGSGCNQPCTGSSCGQTQGCGPAGCEPAQQVNCGQGGCGQSQGCGTTGCGTPALDCGQGGCGQTQGCGPAGCAQVQPQVVGVQPCTGGNCGQQLLAPRPCPGASSNYQNVQAGSACSWMSAPLVQAPQQSSYYQCQPTSNENMYCGQWQERSCGGNQVFNPQVQLCAQPNQVLPQQNFPPCTAGTVPIGQCNVRNQCPGFSTCQQETNTCCQPWQG